MTYLVHVEGAFVAPPGPGSDASPRACSAAYRLRALFPPAATTAATQLFLAEQAKAGLRPAGPLPPAIADGPAEGEGWPAGRPGGCELPTACRWSAPRRSPML